MARAPGPCDHRCVSNDGRGASSEPLPSVTRPSPPRSYGTPLGSAGTPGSGPGGHDLGPRRRRAAQATGHPGDLRGEPVDFVEGLQLRQPVLGGAPQPVVIGHGVQLSPERAGRIPIAAGDQGRAGQRLEPDRRPGHRARALELRRRGPVVLEPPVIDEADVVNVLPARGIVPPAFLEQCQRLVGTARAARVHLRSGTARPSAPRRRKSDRGWWSCRAAGRAARSDARRWPAARCRSARRRESSRRRRPDRRTTASAGAPVPVTAATASAAPRRRAGPPGLGSPAA